MEDEELVDVIDESERRRNAIHALLIWKQHALDLLTDEQVEEIDRRVNLSLTMRSGSNIM